MLLVIISIIIISVCSQEKCVDGQCPVSQGCSVLDQRCYPLLVDFVKTRFALKSPTGAYQAPPPEDVPGVDGVDIGPVLDDNFTTSLFFPGDWSARFVTLYFAEKQWIFGAVVLSDNEIVDWRFLAENITQTAEEVDHSVPGYIKHFISDGLPVFTKQITFYWTANQDVSISTFNVYGQAFTFQPSPAPSNAPTVPSQQPTTSPSDQPTADPTFQPTSYPTIDVCRELTVKQPCCGGAGSTTISDFKNLRNSSLKTCEYSFEYQCCGTTGQWVFGSAVDILYGCKDLVGMHICTTEDFDTSLDPNDNIFGEVISSVQLAPDGYNSFEEYAEVMRSETDPNQCKCLWTVNECDGGKDEAVCGVQEDFDALFSDDCWPQEQTWSAQSDFLYTECWDDITANDRSYDHLAKSPCSAESFQGSVTSIDVISNETIVDEDCSCTYNIQVCDPLVHPTEAKCPKVDESGDPICDGEGCKIKVAYPCCSMSLEADYEMYKGVVPANGTAPSDDQWMCNNDLTELCPDIYNGTRKYNVSRTTHWWYDSDELNARCTCVYESDECDLPTKDPTANPTTEPTVQPTDAPTTTPTKVTDAPTMKPTMVPTMPTMNNDPDDLDSFDEPEFNATDSQDGEGKEGEDNSDASFIHITYLSISIIASLHFLFF